jgi:PAS domain S-box-containing protein
MGERSSGGASRAFTTFARASEEYFQRLLEHVPDAAYTCDAEGLITSFNGSAEKLWGRSPSLRDPAERYCGSLALLTGEGEKLPLERSPMALALEQKRAVVARELMIMRADGTRRSALAHAHPYFDDHGVLLGAVGLLVDVSAHKERELERARITARAVETQRLENLGRFAGGVAHELNNILTIVLGCAELVRRDAVRPDQAARVLSHADEIHNAGARAKQLLHHVHVFSRPSTFGKRLISLTSVVEQALVLMRGTLTRDLTLETHFDENAPAILGDAEQLQQALVQLCVNAAQALKGQKGRLRIAVERVSTQPGELRDSANASEFARLTVSDNGVGMTREVRARMFEPFFSTRELAQGMGLGLWLVQRAVEAHDGSIDVTSEVGQGTTFSLYFPQARA